MSKISELSDGGSLTSTDYLIAVRSGGNVKVRMDQINVDQVDLGDNEFIRLGNSQDLTMVHTSTQSIINQAGIGDLLIQKAGATKLTINASGIDVTGSVTATGTSVFASLDISADIDVDGTTNLDVVDIDGAVDMASTLAVGGKVRVGAATDGTSALMTFDSASNFSSLQMGNNSGGGSAGGVLLYSSSGNEFALYQYAGAVGSETYGASTFSLNSLGGATFNPSASGFAFFNEGGFDADFRAESDTNANMLFVDGGANHVNIGTATDLNGVLNVDGNLSLSGAGTSNRYVALLAETNTYAGTLMLQAGGGSASYGAAVVMHGHAHATNPGMLYLAGSAGAGGKSVVIGRNGNNATAASEMLTAYSSGTELVINEFGNDQDFRVESDAYVSCLQVNAAENAVNFHKSDISVSTSGFSVGIPSAGVTSSMPSGNTYHVYRSDGVDNGYKFYVNFGGQINSTSTSISSLSDERLKENIVDLETGLSEVMALKPRRFDWKNSDNKNVAGFIAQEVETVLPELIGDFLHDDLADAKSVKMGDMVPTLVKAIQEQQELIKTLEARIAALES